MIRPRLYSPAFAPAVVFVITDAIGTAAQREAVAEARRAGYRHILIVGSRTSFADLQRHARLALAGGAA